MSNNLLPSQPICYSGLERVSLSVSQLLRRFSDDRQKGSVTAEAAVAVPVFFLAVVTMLYLLEMMAVHTAVRSGLQYAGKKAAKESCVTQMLMPSRIENDLVYAVGRTAWKKYCKRREQWNRLFTVEDVGPNRDR